MRIKPKIIVVGGGLAGLSAAMRLAELGVAVKLFSVVPVKRSHSVCAQGGINGAVNTKGEGDSWEEHFDDTIYGGDFLANQELPRKMCRAAPDIISLFDRMGVMFNRTPEGFLDFRRFGGTKYHRTAFAGATTGQQLLYALDEQVRRFEVDGLIEKFEGWEFVSAVIDSHGAAKGIVAQHLNSMELHTFKADAVLIATGGPGLVFGRSTNSVSCTGYAATELYKQGAYYANGEFIQIHPTAIPGADKLRLMSESARGEGGRVWVMRDGKPWYFLEEWYPAYGNLVPRDVASRAIHKVVYDLNLGIDGQPMVYLDVSHLPADFLNRKLGGILEIYEKFAGDDPRKVPMRIFPAVHYSMGGLWIDDNHMTNIHGIFAAGECDYQYHGANRLGANSLVSCVFGGLYSAEKMRDYCAGLAKACDEIDEAPFLTEAQKQKKSYSDILDLSGPENAHRLHEELGEIMTANVTIVRQNAKLRQTLAKIQELKARTERLGLSDRGPWMNREAVFVRQFQNMLELAHVITLGALLRDESRGAHFKPEFSERDDEKFLKTTKARYSKDGPQISYEDVDVKYVKPRPRRYDVNKKVVKIA